MSTYIDSKLVGFGPGGVRVEEVTHSWEAHTRIALVWHYGEERADAIQASRDNSTQQDVAAWNNLGITRAERERKKNISIDSPPLRHSVAP